MDKKVFLVLVAFAFTVTACQARSEKSAAEESAVVKEENAAGSVIYLTTAQFKQKVFNYDVNKEWKYEGDLPCILDFYADWCGPCRMIAPTLEQLAKEYSGKIYVYKINTDKEKELAQYLGIQSLPTLVFVPLKGAPQVSMGAMPKETFVKTINDVMLNNNNK